MRSKIGCCPSFLPSLLRFSAPATTFSQLRALILSPAILQSRIFWGNLIWLLSPSHGIISLPRRPSKLACPNSLIVTGREHVTEELSFPFPYALYPQSNANQGRTRLFRGRRRLIRRARIPKWMHPVSRRSSKSRP